MTRFERIAVLGLAIGLLACIGLIGTIIVGSTTANRNTHNLTVLGHRNHSLLQALTKDQERIAKLTRRIANDERKTCRIQRRGLPAGHALASSMRGIHALLTQRPHTAAERAQAAETPKYIKRIVQRLNRHLARYLRLEAQQPKTRKCAVGST